MEEFDNGLSKAEKERLIILIEEMSEVTKIVCKIKRHGYASRNPDVPNSPNNVELLEMELGDLHYAMEFLGKNGDVNPARILDHSSRRYKKLSKYLHYNHKF